MKCSFHAEAESNAEKLKYWIEAQLKPTKITIKSIINNIFIIEETFTFPFLKFSDTFIFAFCKEILSKCFKITPYTLSLQKAKFKNIRSSAKIKLMKIMSAKIMFM